MSAINLSAAGEIFFAKEELERFEAVCLPYHLCYFSRLFSHYKCFFSRLSLKISSSICGLKTTMLMEGLILTIVSLPIQSKRVVVVKFEFNDHRFLFTFLVQNNPTIF